MHHDADKQQASIAAEMTTGPTVDVPDPGGALTTWVALKTGQGVRAAVLYETHIRHRS